MIESTDWQVFSTSLAKMFLSYPSMHGKAEKLVVQAYWDVLQRFDLDVVTRAIVEARRQGVNKDFAPSAAAIEQLAEPLQRTRKVRALPALPGKVATPPPLHTDRQQELGKRFEAEMTAELEYLKAKSGGRLTAEDNKKLQQRLMKMVAGL